MCFSLDSCLYRVDNFPSMKGFVPDLLGYMTNRPVTQSIAI